MDKGIAKNDRFGHEYMLKSAGEFTTRIDSAFSVVSTLVLGVVLCVTEGKGSETILRENRTWHARENYSLSILSLTLDHRIINIHRIISRISPLTKR
jgi:hypothetical protein